MATFKVGQRVRVLPHGGRLAGAECVIRSVHGDYYGVTPKQEVNGSFDWYAMECVLTPIIDPKADEFIERIKKLKPEPVAPAPPVKVGSSLAV